MRTPQKSEELVKPALQGVKFIAPEMPFTNQRRPVTGSPQKIRHRSFPEGQTYFAMGRCRFGVELMAEPLRVTTRQQPCPGGTAIRAADVGVGEANSASGQRVDVRCGDVLAAVDADVRVAHVVADNDNNV